ncbi:MAG: ParB/RepB/Spo0J family partition protein [Candidatus Saccharibacteria bacterium]|nr:ParB/RepB/Spo0J family partition protein [Candidatus Saccharibacteria bacterium]
MARGLGRGFSSLIPTDLVDEEFDITAESDKEVSKLLEIKVSEITRDENQPRQTFTEESLAELAASIKQHGVLQPLVVIEEDGKYVIVAGERRWRAAKMAGLETVPAIVRTIDSQNRLELSIIENAQREDLNPIELATAYAKLKSQFNLSVKEIAERVGKSESSVMNTMRLLNLPEDAKKAMVENGLSEGVMRPLITADKSVIEKAVPLIVSEGWSARRVEQFIAANRKKSSAVAVKTDAQAKQEMILSEKYGAKVRVAARSVTFSCKDEKELSELLEKLK